MNVSLFQTDAWEDEGCPVELISVPLNKTSKFGNATWHSSAKKGLWTN